MKRELAVKIISMMLTCVEKNFQVKNKRLVRSFRRERSMLGLIGTHANIVSMVEYFTQRDEVSPKQPSNSGKNDKHSLLKILSGYII